MEDILKKRELYPMDIGSIVGTHTGPGACLLYTSRCV